MGKWGANVVNVVPQSDHGSFLHRGARTSLLVRCHCAPFAGMLLGGFSYGFGPVEPGGCLTPNNMNFGIHGVQNYGQTLPTIWQTVSRSPT